MDSDASEEVTSSNSSGFDANEAETRADKEKIQLYLDALGTIDGDTISFKKAYAKMIEENPDDDSKSNKAQFKKLFYETYLNQQVNLVGATLDDGPCDFHDFGEDGLYLYAPKSIIDELKSNAELFSSCRNIYDKETTVKSAAEIKNESQDVFLDHYINATVTEISEAIDFTSLDQDDNDETIIRICSAKLKIVSDLIQALYVMEKLTQESAAEYYNFLKVKKTKVKKTLGETSRKMVLNRRHANPKQTIAELTEMQIYRSSVQQTGRGIMEKMLQTNKRCMKRFKINEELCSFEKHNIRTYSFIACIIAEVDKLKPQEPEHSSQLLDSSVPKNHDDGGASALNNQIGSENELGLKAGAVNSYGYGQKGGNKNSVIIGDFSSPVANAPVSLKPPTTPSVLHQNSCVVLYSSDMMAYLVGNYLKPKYVDPELVQNCVIKMGCSAYSAKNNLKKLEQRYHTTVPAPVIKSVLIKAIPGEEKLLMEKVFHAMLKFNNVRLATTNMVSKRGEFFERFRYQEDVLMDYMPVVLGILTHLQNTKPEFVDLARPVYEKIKELRDVKTENLPHWFQERIDPTPVVNIAVQEDSGWAIYAEHRKSIRKSKAEQIIKEKNVQYFVNKLFFHIADRKTPESDFELLYIGCKDATTILQLYLELTKKLHSYVSSVRLTVIERDKGVCEAGELLINNCLDDFSGHRVRINFDQRDFMSIENSELSSSHVVISCISNVTPFFAVKFIGLASCLAKYNSTHIKLLVASKGCCKSADEFISIKYEKFVSFEYEAAKSRGKHDLYQISEMGEQYCSRNKITAPLKRLPVKPNECIWENFSRVWNISNESRNSFLQCIKDVFNYTSMITFTLCGRVVSFQYPQQNHIDKPVISDTDYIEGSSAHGSLSINPTGKLAYFIADEQLVRDVLEYHILYLNWVFNTVTKVLLKVVAQLNENFGFAETEVLGSFADIFINSTSTGNDIKRLLSQLAEERHKTVINSVRVKEDAFLSPNENYDDIENSLYDKMWECLFFIDMSMFLRRPKVNKSDPKQNKQKVKFIERDEFTHYTPIMSLESMFTDSKNIPILANWSLGSDDD